MNILHVSTVSSGTFSVNEDSSVQIVAEESVAIDQLDRDVSNLNLQPKSQGLYPPVHLHYCIVTFVQGCDYYLA